MPRAGRAPPSCPTPTREPPTARPPQSAAARPPHNAPGQPGRRACDAADRTGHMILQTLYQQCIKQGVTFCDEFQVLDLLRDGDAVCGVVAVDLSTGEIHLFHAAAVIFATGGHGRAWDITSNAHSYTGDGVAVCLRRGLPAADMEV